MGGGGQEEALNRRSRAGAHAPKGEGSASAAGPTAQSEYPSARKAAWAAKATPSWAPRRAGRAALTTAIAAASLTIVPLQRGLGFDLSGRSVSGRGGRWKPRRRSVGLGMWRFREKSSHAVSLLGAILSHLTLGFLTCKPKMT